MPALEPFTPSLTKAITVSATSAALALPLTSSPVQRPNQVMVSSLAANAVAFIAFGISTDTVVIPTGTASNGTPILPGTVQIFTVPPTATHILSIGTAANTLYVTEGDGA